jgi:hypothetical protein
VSKWENDADPVGPQSDLLIRSVAVTLSDASKEISRKVVEGFAEIVAAHTTKALSVDADKDYEVKRVA